MGAALVIVTASTGAHANGRFPATNQLIVSAKDPSFLVLRATYGFLVSHDAGATWDWICEVAIGYNGSEDPAIAVTANGNVVATTFEGVVVSSQGACSWNFATLPSVMGHQQVYVDVTQQADARDHIFVLSNSFAGVDGGSQYDSQIYASTDNGASWAPQGTKIDSSLILETVDVAPSDPHRLYVTGVTGTNDNDTMGVFLVSKDDGTTWAKHPFMLDATAKERAPFIAGVDPKNPERLYVRTQSSDMGGPSRLLVTDNASADNPTFRVVFQAQGNLQGFALSPDGSKVFVGSPQDGLLMANSTDLKFTKKSSVAIQCLAMSGSTIYACSGESSGFVLGASDDDGATFTSKLHLCGFRGQLACGTGTSLRMCDDLYPQLRDNLGCNVTPGEGDADVDALPVPRDAGTPPPDPKSGCDVAGGGDGLAVFGIGAFAGIAAFARRRRRR
jgi:hypothetical protein